MRVLSIMGTRPEAIKLAPVIRELESRPEAFESRVCVTGQHRNMMDQVLSVWGIDPDVDLAVMRPRQSLSHVASAVIEGLDRVLQTIAPDQVLVQGDTTTAMAATLAAFHRGIPVGHVEAGLRTYDLARPFPEEANRRIIGLLATTHFAPSAAAAQNLLREGLAPASIVVTGNTVIDAFLQAAAQPLDLGGTPLAGIDASGRPVVLVTCHRRENFGAGLARICSAIKELAGERREVLFVLPVHPNPSVGTVVLAALDDVPNVVLVPPLDYQPLVWLLHRCAFVVTDSGGLQEEATAVGRPVLVLRDSTERPEGVDAGTAELVGSDRLRILQHVRLLLDDPEVYRRMSRRTYPYGDGRAAARIVDHLSGIAPAPSGLPPQQTVANEGRPWTGVSPARTPAHR